jgi:hypothetical protein
VKNRRVAGIFWAFLFASFAFSQSKKTGELRGIVTDPGGSSVPGAKVAAPHSDTGSTAEAANDDCGNIDSSRVARG